MGVKRVLAAVVLAWSGLPALPAGAADLRLALPPRLIESGLDTHLLPRFRFRTQVQVEAVAPGDGADVELTAAPVEAAPPVFRGQDGATYRLRVLGSDPEVAERAGQLLAWLRSAPGRAAIESFEIDGTRPLLAGAAPTAEVEAVVVDGDAALGSRLALTHCGRCHVIDARNPFGGIGSTPSFAAMRGDADWQARFEGFWSFNPHPAFTQVEGITPPFPPDRPPAIAPLELTLEETRAITAFVATLAPKDLGARVEAR